MGEFLDHTLIAVLALSLSQHVSRWEKWTLRALAVFSALVALEIALIAAPGFLARHWHG